MFTKVEVLEFSDIQKNTWDDFLLNYKNQATVFHTQEWMKTLQEAHGYKPKYLAGMNDDDSFVAVMPFMIDKRYGIENYLSMPYDTYGGVIGDLDTHLALYHNFLRLPGIGVRYYVDYNLLYQDGTIITTELIDISQDVDKIWNGFHKGNQRAIKSASKNNVIVKTSTENLNFLNRISPELINPIIKNMVPCGYCIPYNAYVDNKLASVSLFFIYGDMAIYWAGTTNELGRKMNSHHLLMWEAIQYAKTKGCKIFNFGASPLNANSLMQFKKSWGAYTHQYIKKQRIPALLYPLYTLKQVLRV
jgi:hypothetical protein